MRLCAIVRVSRMSRLPGVKPATYLIREAELLETRIHDETVTHADPEVMPGDVIRLCVPMTLVQELPKPAPQKNYRDEPLPFGASQPEM